jgi:hypothetical protein
MNMRALGLSLFGQYVSKHPTLYLVIVEPFHRDKKINVYFKKFPHIYKSSFKFIEMGVLAFIFLFI